MYVCMYVCMYLAWFGEEGCCAVDEGRHGMVSVVDNIVLVNKIADNKRQQLAHSLSIITTIIKIITITKRTIIIITIIIIIRIII